MAWIVETLNAAVDAEVNALPADMRAQLSRISFMMQEFGLERMHEPHVKHLQGPLWEMRMRAGTAFRGRSRRPARQAGRDCSDVCKEDAEDAPPGNRTGTEPGQRGAVITRIDELHTGWIKEAAYRGEYEALEGEFALATALIRARADAGLTQEQLAERMGTKQEVVARWEGGKVMPSTRTLARLAKATGTTLRISFAPAYTAGT